MKTVIISHIFLLLLILNNNCSNTDKPTENEPIQDVSIQNLNKDSVYLLELLNPTFSNYDSVNNIENKKSDDSIVAKDVNVDFETLKSIIPDGCNNANKIREIILEFIKNNNQKIYSKEFLNLLKYNATNIEKNFSCYFPRNKEEVSMYYFLVDSILLDKSNVNPKAIKLIFDLYIINKNNAELSENLYYLIPSLFFNNFYGCLKYLDKFKESDVEKIISPLWELDNDDKFELMKKISIIDSNMAFFEYAKKVETQINQKE